MDLLTTFLVVFFIIFVVGCAVCYRTKKTVPLTFATVTLPNASQPRAPYPVQESFVPQSMPAPTVYMPNPPVSNPPYPMQTGPMMGLPYQGPTYQIYPHPPSHTQAVPLQHQDPPSYAEATSGVAPSYTLGFKQSPYNPSFK